MVNAFIAIMKIVDFLSTNVYFFKILPFFLMSLKLKLLIIYEFSLYTFTLWVRSMWRCSNNGVSIRITFLLWRYSSIYFMLWDNMLMLITLKGLLPLNWIINSLKYICITSNDSKICTNLFPQPFNSWKPLWHFSRALQGWRKARNHLWAHYF